MLQRIQTLWMLLAVACAVGTLKFSFYSGNKPNATPAAAPVFQSLTATGSILLLILTVLLIVAGLINIFNYKNRKRQIWINIGLIFVSLLNIFLYYQQTKNFSIGTYDLSAVLSLAIPICLFLAVRGIARDQKLVKSTDRLR
ncbi:MAG TPA: DUF4293 domain-containing protein [Puia sp.]